MVVAKHMYHKDLSDFPIPLPMQGLNVSIGNVFVVVSGGRHRSLGVLFLSLVQGPGAGASLSSSMLVEELLPYFPPSPLLSDLPRLYLLSFSNAGIDRQNYWEYLTKCRVSKVVSI